MTTKTFYQLVDIPDYRFNKNTNLNFSDIACDCETKTISILRAINFISLSLASQSQEDGINNDTINDLSCVIADLADLCIATNKISNSANYSSGYQDCKNEN